MAGPQLTEYLAAGDMDRFTALIRRYNHDVLSRSGNMALGAELASKLLRKRSESVLVNPNMADLEASRFDALLQEVLDLSQPIREFVWGGAPDDPEAVFMRSQQWHPFDATVWDKFVADYIAFVRERVKQIEFSVQQIEAWAQSDVLTPPDQCGDFRTTLASIRQTLDDVWAMLNVDAAEQRVAVVVEKAE
jgi:hypothetical protein